MSKRKALGKGLSALIPDVDQTETLEGQFLQCPIEAIEPNPNQPRQDFKETDLAELVDSIQAKGVITPILVSKTETGYQLIAGERRWRAAQKAGLERVPVVVRDVTPLESMELALIENIHRKDLNAIEEALAYKRLLEDSGETQDAVARRLGKDRSTITNMIRLLNLPKYAQQDVIDGVLSMGHARVLAGIKSGSEIKKLRDLVLKKALSVRQLEARAQKKPGSGRPERKKTEEDYYMESLAEKLKRFLGTKVEIRRRGKTGNIVIHFYSDSEFERLLELLS